MLLPPALFPRALALRAPVVPDFHHCTVLSGHILASDCEAAGDGALPRGNIPVRYDLLGAPGPFSLPWTATYGKARP